MSRNADYRKLLETPRFDSVIDVVAWEDALSSLDPDADYWGEVNVGVIESGLAAHYNSWRTRLWRAWEALHGRAWPFLEFCTPTDLEDFVKTLQEAAAVAFPEGSTE